MMATIEIWNYRNRCDCGAYLTATGRDAKVIIYTRNGTHEAKHAEYRYRYRKMSFKNVFFYSGVHQRHVEMGTFMDFKQRESSYTMTTIALKDLIFLLLVKQGTYSLTRNNS